jgi:hypothetical protein
MNFILSLVGLLATPLLHAHEGHGLDGHGHWHATDSWGFLMLGLVAALAWWFHSRK